MTSLFTITRSTFETRFPETRSAFDRCSLLARAVLLAGLCLGWQSFGGMGTATAADDVIERVNQRCVKIFGAGGFSGLHAYGSGFLISEQGHILTVSSHILDERVVTVNLYDGRKMEAKVVGIEPTMDLAVLKLEPSSRANDRVRGRNRKEGEVKPGEIGRPEEKEGEEKFPHFNLEDIATVGPGAKVLAFSNMYKVATGDEPMSVLHGVVMARTPLSARRGVFENPYTGPVYVLDAITNNPGSPGGVVTTRDGQLLGMIGKEVRNSQTNTWINYALPMTELKQTITEIITGRFESKKDPMDQPGRPRRYVPLDFGLVMVPDVVFRTPAFIDDVVPNSPAAKLGLKPNDLVLFVKDELIVSVKHLQDELGSLNAGEKFPLVVRRGNMLVNIELVAEKKADPEPVKKPAPK